MATEDVSMDSEKSITQEDAQKYRGHSETLNQRSWALADAMGYIPEGVESIQLDDEAIFQEALELIRSTGPATRRAEEHRALIAKKAGLE